MEAGLNGAPVQKPAAAAPKPEAVITPARQTADHHAQDLILKAAIMMPVQHQLQALHLLLHPAPQHLPALLLPLISKKLYNFKLA